MVLFALRMAQFNMVQRFPGVGKRGSFESMHALADVYYAEELFLALFCGLAWLGLLKFTSLMEVAAARASVANVS